MNVKEAIFCVVLLPFVLSDKNRLQDKMYTEIKGSICFRRLNATHSTGCSSTLRGSVGVLHLIESADDFEFVTNKPPAPPYTLIIPPWLFTRQYILDVTVRAKNNIAGIVLIENATNLNTFSHELKCPNQNGGLKDQTCDANQPNSTWNPFGTGLLHENFPFPMIYVKDADQIKKLIDCYNAFNAFDRKHQHERRLCSIQIKSFMSAAVNSVVCTRRSNNNNHIYNMIPQHYCDPLQSKNVYATLFPRPAEKKAENWILVGARIDTTSMFEGLGLGAMDSLVPAVTLMSTAHTLNKLLANHTKGQYNVLFMFFNGEAYDYIGSQRFVYDLKRGEFPASSNNPINLTDIKLFIDIGSMDSQNSTTIYQFGEFALADEIYKLFTNNIQKYRFNFDVERKTTKTHLPPTSAQTFLRENDQFPALIFYSDKNKNRFYHSIYDNEKNIDFVYWNTSRNFIELVNLTESKKLRPSIQLAIRNVSSSLAFSLYNLVTGTTYDDNLAANPYLIDEILYCYLMSADCPLFLATLKGSSYIIAQFPPQRYISVDNPVSNYNLDWTYRVLGILTGRPEPSITKENCTVPPLFWFVYNGTSVCLNTTQHSSKAYSPAFSIENYNWSSGQYSTWTESVWSETNIRIFLKPAVSQEAFTLAIGFGVMLISFVLVFIINTKSDELFGESTSSINVPTLPLQC